jgi:hypothetical protein
MDSQRTATHMFALRLPPDLYEATRAKAATATAALNSTFGQTARGEHMQQFAIAALAPRSIAWLISADDWAHLESLVAYNCALLGGYFNALIPLMRGGAIDAAYEHFLLAYDPDLIVLAPDMEQTALEHSCGAIPASIRSEWSPGMPCISWPRATRATPTVRG